jgi:hypothetical protein
VNGRITVFRLSGISNMDKHMYLMNSTNCVKYRIVEKRRASLQINECRRMGKPVI